MASVTIGNKRIGDGEPTFIVAEIGINHNGDIALAKKLIDVALLYGADAVKFQKRTIPLVYSKEELEKPREVPKNILERALERGVLSEEAVKRLKRSNFQASTNGDLKMALEFTFDEYKEINRYAKEREILWFASPWDVESVDFLEEFNPPCYKIASALLTDDELLRHIHKTGRPKILSTGMSNLEMIRHAVDVLGKDNLVILHCTSTYPSDPRDLHLNGIPTLKRAFPENPIGYSGHEVGLVPSVCAVMFGACLIERHVTLDRAMFGSDQAASIEPHGVEQLVKYIRTTETVGGSGEIEILDSELPLIEKLRKKK